MSERSNVQKFILYDSIHVQFKNRQPVSMVLEVRRGFPGMGWGGEVWTGRGTREPSGAIGTLS